MFIMKAVVIHGFEGSADSNWFPWIEAELVGKGYEVFNETFPNADHPNLNEVLEFYRPQMNDVDLVIGHSLGAFIALKLSEEFKFTKLVLVAPAIGTLNYPYMYENWEGSDVDSLKSFIGNGFNSNLLKVDQGFALFSLDDPYVPLVLRELLPENWIVSAVEGKHHFQEEIQYEILDVL